MLNLLEPLKYFFPFSAGVMPGIKKCLAAAAACAWKVESARQTMLLALQQIFNRTMMDYCACLQHQLCPQNSMMSYLHLGNLLAASCDQRWKKDEHSQDKYQCNYVLGVRGRGNFPHV